MLPEPSFACVSHAPQGFAQREGLQSPAGMPRAQNTGQSTRCAKGAQPRALNLLPFRRLLRAAALPPRETRSTEL